MSQGAAGLHGIRCVPVPVLCVLAFGRVRAQTTAAFSISGLAELAGGSIFKQSADMSTHHPCTRHQARASTRMRVLTPSATAGRSERHP